MCRNIFKRLCLLLVFVLAMTHVSGCALLYTSYEMEDSAISAADSAKTTAKANSSSQSSKDDSSQKNDSSQKSNSSQKSDSTGEELDEDGSYYSKDDVALYIHTYGKLPDNFITKKEAQKLGWEGGSVDSYAPGKAIGGDRFGNYEGNLPEKKGRTYTECDIDTKGKSRGAKRIVFSNDGLIYYTDDHYETFTLLYGDE